MSPIAKKLLSAAYENYLKTGDVECIYQCTDSNDFYYAVEAARQLYEDELITSDLDFISSRKIKNIPVSSLSISFALSEKGLEKI